jgi:hypothetical protein
MSRVHKPVRVGITGGGGCGCGLGICNPSLTHTRDMGSQVLPVSHLLSHAVTKPKEHTNKDHPPQHKTGTTAHERPQLPPVKVHERQGAHPRPPPTTTQNEYDHHTTKCSRSSTPVHMRSTWEPGNEKIGGLYLPWVIPYGIHGINIG